MKADSLGGCTNINLGDLFYTGSEKEGRHWEEVAVTKSENHYGRHKNVTGEGMEMLKEKKISPQKYGLNENKEK